MNIYRAITVLISLLLIVGVVLSGCSGNGTSTSSSTTSTSPSPGYVQATAVKRGVSFSFEYPASYTKLTPDAFEDNVSNNSVSLLYTDPGSTMAKADIQIYIIPLQPILSRPDAHTWSEENIKIIEQNDDGFILHDSSSIEVAGLTGYKTFYFSTILGVYLNSSRLECRDVYVDYKGYIWKITVLAVAEMGDQAEPVFQQLIKSFKFLD